VLFFLARRAKSVLRFYSPFPAGVPSRCFFSFHLSQGHKGYFSSISCCRDENGFSGEQWMTFRLCSEAPILDGTPSMPRVRTVFPRRSLRCLFFLSVGMRTSLFPLHSCFPFSPISLLSTWVESFRLLRLSTVASSTFPQQMTTFRDLVYPAVAES